MSEELYNSNDYCSLAEENEELKKENAELLADKLYLIGAAMDGGDKYHYAAHDIGYRDMERKVKALEADYVISNRELLILQQRIAELKAENDRLQDAWFLDETICPDGSLRPKVSDLLNRIAELSQAVGLITTLKPTMVMDANHPLDMVREVAEHVTARIAELEAAQRWIPVGERLPEAETRVLAATPTGYMEVDWRFSEPIIDCGFANFFSLDNVTHWMPLPEPPEVQE